MVEEVLNRLREYGLNRYEGAVYLSLLEIGEADAKEIAARSGVPLQRIYNVLEDLEGKGLVKATGGKPKRFLPVEPQEALENLIRRAEIECLIRVARLRELKEELLKMLPRKGINSPFTTEIIRGEENIRARVAQMLKGAQREVKIAGEKPLFRLGCKGALRRLIPPRVRLRVIGRFDSECKREIEAVGGQYRERDSWCNYLLIADDRKLLNVYRTPKGWEALYTEELSFIKPFAVAFEVNWNGNRGEGSK